MSSIRLGRDLVKATVAPTQKLTEQQPVWINFDPAKLHLFDAVREDRLYSSSVNTPLAITTYEP